MQEPIKKQIRKYKWSSFHAKRPLMVTPFGYVQDENDPTLYHPIPDALDILEAGKVALANGRPVREVAKWISKTSGISISHMGLVKRIESDNKKFKRLEKTGQTKYVDVTDITEPTAMDELNDLWRRKKVDKRHLSNKDKKIEKIKEKKKKLADYKGAVTRLKKSLKTEIERTKDEALKEELTELVNDEILSTEVDIVEDEQEIAFRPNDGPQTDFLAASEDEVFYGGARGGGKVQLNQSLIATPFGFRLIGDLKVGDIILSPSGSPQRVLQIHEQPVQDFYTFIFEDGASCEVGLDHLWLVKISSTHATKRENFFTGYFADGEVVTSKFIMEWLDKKKEAKDGVITKRHLTIPVCKPLKFNRSYRYNPLTIDPYLLGVMLGDGSISSCGVDHMIFTGNDPEIAERLRQKGFEVEHKYNKCWRVVDIGIKEKFKKLELYETKTNTKFIPECYKWATLEQRIELMQGLMDTDGYVDDRGHMSYTTISKQLAEDVQFLARSLGANAKITEKETSFTLMVIRNPVS